MQTARRRYTIAVAIGLAAAALALGLCAPGMRSSLPGEFLWRLELASYDFRLRNSVPNITSDDVVIVAIDEQSIAEIGLWPWSRGYHAQVVENLAAAGARLIGLDIIMSSVSNPEVALEAAEDQPLDWEPPPSEEDLAVADALAKAGNVILALSISSGRIEGEELDAEVAQAQFPYWRFEEAALGLGVVSVPKEVDGSVRRYWVEQYYQDEPYPTMPVALAAAYLGKTPQELSEQVLSAARLRRTVPHDDGFMVAYRGEPGTGFVHIPYYQVLRASAPDRRARLGQQVRDKVVMIGATAATLQDLYDTPLSVGSAQPSGYRAGRQMPGVEVMASALDTILTRSYIGQAPALLVLAATAVLALLVALVVVRLGPLWSTVAGWLPALTAGLLLCLVVWDRYHLWLPFIPLVLAATVSYVGSIVYLELTTERQRRRLYRSWSQRVSPEVLHVILDNPGLTHIKGRRLTATVLFTDLRGFTSFCHEEEPEKVVAELDQYLSMITRIVRRHGGTVHKFIGDGVMAVFGDPVPQPDHALRAVRAARDMQQEMARLRANVQEGEWEAHLRVGIHTGVVVAGDVGSGELLEYTVIGDTVSTASRLEGLNKEYGTQIMISRATHEAAGPTIRAKSLGRAEIRGRAESLEVMAVDPWV